MLIREIISNKIWPVFLVVAFSFAGCSRPIDSENVNSAEMEADAIETGDSQAANGDQKTENNHTADDNQKTENNHAADANPETENHQGEEEDQKQSIWEKSEELFVLVDSCSITQMAKLLLDVNQLH